MEHNLPLQPPPRNEIELIDQVGLWANYNFGNVRGPDYGIAEEIGEAIRAILKRRQKIRGYDNQIFFFDKFTDALGDAMIYLADWCYIHNSFFKFNRNQMKPAPEIHGNPEYERRIICHLLQASSQMFTYDEVRVGDTVEVGESQVYNMIAQQICNGLEYWAAVYDFDLPMIVNETWEIVKRRDWKKNRAQG